MYIDQPSTFKPKMKERKLRSGVHLTGVKQRLRVISARISDKSRLIQQLDLCMDEELIEREC
jgi:hypothetical protein